MSWLDRAVKRGVEQAVQKWVKDCLPEIIDKAILQAADKRLPSGDLTRQQFVIAMAARYVASFAMPAADAPRYARDVLRGFLNDDRIKFGDPAYDWSREGAHTVVWECDVQYWEAS